MTKPVTSDELDVVYEFYEQKFNESRGTDAYFMLSKIEFQLLEIKPTFCRTTPEFESRFCQDLYGIIEMPNYCINCLKFIDHENLVCKYEYNTCPVCGCEFCCGYCSSEPSSHPCEVINKIRLNSYFFDPEVIQVKLKTDILLNEARNREIAEEDLESYVDHIKIDENNIEESISNDSYILQITPNFKHIFKQSADNKENEAERQLDPFIYPYFIKICKLYSDHLEKVRINQMFIEHKIVEIMQFINSLTAKEIKIIEYFNDFSLLLAQASEKLNFEQLLNLGQTAEQKYVELEEIFDNQMNEEAFTLPDEVKGIMKDVYNLVSEKIVRSIKLKTIDILKEEEAIVANYNAIENEIEKNERELTKYEECRYEESLEQSRNMIMEEFNDEKEFTKGLNYNIYEDNQLVKSVLSKAQLLENKFSGLLSNEGSNVLVQREEPAKDEESNILLATSNNSTLESESEPLDTEERSEEFRAKSARLDNSKIRLIRFSAVNNTEEDRRSRFIKEDAVLLSKAPNAIERAQIREKPHDAPKFTRKVVFMENGLPNGEELEYLVNQLEKQGNEKKRSQSCTNERKPIFNVMQYSRNLRRELEEERETEKQLLYIWKTQNRIERSEEKFTIDTRIIRPFFYQLLEKLSYLKCQFYEETWFLMTLYLNANEETEYQRNFKEYFRSLRYFYYCKEKLLLQGFNDICKNTNQQYELHEKEIVLGSESRKRLKLVLEEADDRINYMPDATRLAIYKEIRDYVFNMASLDQYDGIINLYPVTIM